MPGSAELAYWVECVGSCGCAMMVEDPATIAWIQNTLRLDRLWVNEPLWTSVSKNPVVEPIGDFQPMLFNESGGLVLNWPG